MFQITTGAVDVMITKTGRTEMSFDPVLQIHNIKAIGQPVPGSTSNLRYRVSLTDGLQKVIGIISSGLAGLIQDSRIVEHSIVRLKLFTVNQNQGTAMIVIIDLEVVCLIAAPLVTLHNSVAALLDMANLGNLKLVESVLDCGVNVDSRGRCSETALIKSSRAGHLDVVKLLVSKGANIHYRGNPHIHNFQTALHEAAFNAHIPVCLFLISLGAQSEDILEAGKIYGERQRYTSANNTIDNAAARAALMAAGFEYIVAKAAQTHNPVLQLPISSNASLLFSDAFSDLVFVCPGGERIHAHRCIVAACSPHMNALLQGPWAENADERVAVVKMPQSAEAVRALLKFMYTGEVDAAACASDPWDVLDLASQHQQPALVAACECIVLRSLSVQNVILARSRSSSLP